MFSGYILYRYKEEKQGMTKVIILAVVFIYAFKMGRKWERMQRL